MSDVIENPLIESFETLLDEERQILLEGKLDALSDLLERKENLFEDLQAQQDEDALDAEELAPLQALFNRNHALLESTQRGLRATTERLGTLRRVRTSLETYGNNGQRQSVQMNSGQRLEKRA